MKKIITFLFIIIVSISSAQINKYLRKGSKALEKNKLEKAKVNYLKAYNLDKSAYETNAGLGHLLSENLNKYEEALPYLETAYNKTPADTLPEYVDGMASTTPYI